MEGNANQQKRLAHSKLHNSAQLLSYRVCQKCKKYDCKISGISHFERCHFAMPPLGGAAENYNYILCLMQRHQKFA